MMGDESGRRGDGEEVREREFRRFGHEWVVLVDIAEEAAAAAAVMVVVVVMVESEIAGVNLGERIHKATFRMCDPKGA